MRYLACLAAIAALSTPLWAAPSTSITIPGGQYKLTWRVPPARDVMSGMGFDSESSIGSIETNAMRISNKQSVTGLTSSKALCSAQQPFAGKSLIVIIDESKGTGTGYDTAYFTPGPALGKSIDLSKALKVKIGPDPYAQVKDKEWKQNLEMLDDPADAVIDVQLGGAQTGQLKQIGVESIRLSFQGSDGSFPYLNVKLRGLWKAVVPTDNGGQFTFTALDRDGDACFNDVSKPYSLVPDPAAGGDSLLVSYIGGDGARELAYLSIGRPSLFAGKLYIATNSALGDTVTIKPYAGGVGSVKIVTVDGYGKLAGCGKAEFRGTAGEFSLYEKDTLTVPAGAYTCSVDIVRPGGSLWNRNPEDFTVTLDTTKSVTVKDGLTSVVKLGGPVTAGIAPGRKEVTATQGMPSRVEIGLSVGSPGGKINFLPNEFKATVSAIDSRGKSVWTGSLQSDFGQPYCVLLPGTLKAGNYKLVAKISGPKYQKTTTTSKPLHVTKLALPKGLVGIKPGSYTTRWENVSDYNSAPFWPECPLKLMTPDEIARVKGISLNKPYITVQDRITAIVDMPNLEGASYTRAYVLWDAPAKGPIDLSKALKVQLADHGGQSGFEGDMHPTFDSTDQHLSLPIVLGEGKSRVARKAQVEVNLNFRPDPDGSEQPYSMGVNLKTYPSVTIPASPYPVTIRLYDGGDGIYGGKLNKDNPDYIRISDGEVSPHSVPQPLGPIISHRGRLYSVKLSSAGDRITINPYSGPVGKLKLDVTDAKGKQPKESSIEIVGQDTALWAEGKAGVYTLPVGDYKCQVGVRSGSVYTWMASDKAISIAKGQVTNVKMGGPIRATLEPKTDAIVAKPGERKPLDVQVRAGQDYCRTNGDITATILDAAGQALSGDVIEVDYGQCGRLDLSKAIYTLVTPVGFTPGNYTLSVHIDTDTYQGMITVNKPLKITGID